MTDKTYAVLAVATRFSDFAKLVARQLGENFDETDERDDLVLFVRHEANQGDMPLFERGLEERFIPYDLRWDPGAEFDAGGRQLRVRRNADGALELQRHEYYDSMRQLDAKFVAELIDSGDTSELRRTAANAMSAGAPIDDPLEDAPFLKEHDAALETLRSGATQSRE